MPTMLRIVAVCHCYLFHWKYLWKCFGFLTKLRSCNYSKEEEVRRLDEFYGLTVLEETIRKQITNMLARKNRLYDHMVYSILITTGVHSLQEAGYDEPNIWRAVNRFIEFNLYKTSLKES